MCRLQLFHVYQCMPVAAGCNWDLIFVSNWFRCNFIMLIADVYQKNNMRAIELFE
jgi:hypothetical protein